MTSNQKQAMRALQQRVQKAENIEMVLTNSKRYNSKSNGNMEKAIQEVEGQIRPLKLHTEEHIGKTIPPDQPIIHWMVEYAAETINRFRIFNKKSTPREAISGRHTFGRMAEFREMCCGSRKLGKAVEWESWNPSSSKPYSWECAR